MAKLKGKAKAEFLKRMALGRKKAAKKTSTKKGSVRKTARRAFEPKRKTATNKRKSSTLNKTKPRRKPMAKRFKRTRKAGRGIASSLKTGMVGEIVKGIGAGSLATIVVGRVAPQYAPIASIGAGFLTGGIIGGAANLLLSGGLTSLGGMFGGTQNVTAQTEAGV
tara:strand:- start:1195 stop:1689 length:495 start_codon:yes stop_codon:yes gene_type:complete